MTNKAEVTQIGLFDMQVCVPEDWPDNKVMAFADQENPCGTEGGWFIRRAGDKALTGADERVLCGERRGFVHLMMDA